MIRDICLGFIKQYYGLEYSKRSRLYPDQLVYINKVLGDVIRFQNGRILYNAAEKPAKVIKETLLG